MNGQSPTNNGMNNQDNLNGNVLGTVLGNTQSPSPVSQQSPQINAVPNVNATQGAVNNIDNNSLVTPSIMPNTIPNENVNQAPNVTPMPNNGTVDANITPLSNTAPQETAAQAPNITSENNLGAAQMPTSSPVAVPIPGTEGIPNNLTGNTVGASATVLGGANNNNFIDPKKMGNIGSMPPPTDNTNNKKKPMNKVLFVILILVLIALVAYGVYYFLSICSSKVKLTTKTVTIGVGETLSDKISDYATITSGDVTSCTLNTRNVDINTIGQYDFTITCGKDSYSGKVNVSDVTAPDVDLNIVFKQVSDTVTIEDFISSCTDPSNCTTAFVNESTVNNYLSSPGGPYSVSIKASDSAGNEKTVDGILYVTPYAIVAFTKCSSPSENLSGYQATKVTTDMFPIGNDGTGIVHLGVARRTYTYVFSSESEYIQVIGNKDDTITFDGVTGVATYDDENYTLEISVDLSIDTLNSENNGAFPSSYTDFQNLYKVEKGYSCSNTAYISNNN